MASQRTGGVLRPAVTLRSALGNRPLKSVDIETLEELEKSSQVECYLDPDAPRTLYIIVQNHLKNSSNGRIFDDSYGLVCVRLLIRLIHVVICENDGSLARIEANVNTTLAKSNTLAILSQHASNVVLGDTGASLGALNSLHVKSKKLFNNEELFALLDIFWKDRKVFLVLYKKEALPGFLLLLYMIWIRVSGVVGEMDPYMMNRLRDLLLRTYLVASIWERETIRLLCIYMYQVHDCHADKSIPYDEEDSRAIAHAYNRCIMVQVDPDPLKGMKLDVYRYLLEFVSDLVGSTLFEEFPLVISAAIERFWMAFDTEKVEFLIPPDDRRSQIMYYAGDLSYAVK
ncbi:MYND Zn-finger protein [Ceratobasidium sp. AG-Ba]|nr:MYND Zn-finger protein [Ceratobasidium sp. AG-Ba]QRW04856.1 MYND Zn-finger protein [Ceratobasidium sp. AG-Ba]